MALQKIFLKEGDLIGRCIFIKELERKGKYLRRVWCRCICGKEFENTLSKVLRGRTCGCRRHESHNLKHGHNRTGGATTEYSIWTNMLNRCRNEKLKSYKDYGARGIRVCDEWKSFENFLRDMGNRPSLLYSLDRIDVNGNYTSSNCRWATVEEQYNNRTDNHYIEYNGEKMTISQWSRKTGIRPQVIGRRIRRGWSAEKTLTTPLMQNQYIFKKQTNG